MRDTFYNIHYKPARYWRIVDHYRHSSNVENLLMAEKIYKNLLHRYLDKKNRMTDYKKKNRWEYGIRDCTVWLEYLSRKIESMDGRYDK